MLEVRGEERERCTLALLMDDNNNDDDACRTTYAYKAPSSTA